jgi:hypothetical protein
MPGERVCGVVVGRLAWWRDEVGYLCAGAHFIADTRAGLPDGDWPRPDLQPTLGMYLIP